MVETGCTGVAGVPSNYQILLRRSALKKMSFPQLRIVQQAGGKLHTGDLAIVDEEGFIFVVDRAKDFIKCGGNRVGCRAVEDVILRYPGIVEAAVIPQYDEALGEAVCLCAVHPEGESVREDLIKYCGRHLPWDQVPRSVHFLKDLPRNFSGKVDKQALKRLYGRCSI